MAEGFLSNLAAALTSKVSSLLLNEIVLLWDANDELAKLRDTVETIGAVLLDAEEKSLHSPPVKLWLEKLSEAMYDAEDLLDEISYEALRQQLMGGSEFSKKVRLFFSSSNQVAFGLKMGHKVEKLRKRFDEIAEQRHKFHLEDRSGERSPFVLSVRDSSHSTPPQVVIGREADKEEVVGHLLSSGSEDQDVSFISIQGIGGLGKTTLAQMVYNDDRVKSHFEVKIWVCVSDEFDVKLLVTKIIESATKKAPECKEMDPLKNILHDQIKDKRYLLVLDDVWNEDVNKWMNFKDLLLCGSKGSKVVVTTRSEKVADMSQPIHKHHMTGLLEEDAWSLFKNMAFKQGEPPNRSFEDMGKGIVAKCCGVPLAIKTIGALLQGSDSESQWQSFKEKELSRIPEFQTDILPILKLSYNHLPFNYKCCYAYCSLFPKDFRISVDRLIQLWKAQGYVHSTNQSESLGDVGLKYFKDLLRLSFFQDVDYLGNIVYCKMHDLMHDLAVSVAGDNFFVSSERKMTSIKNNTRHMSFWGYDLRHASPLLKAKKIRTILTFELHEQHVFKTYEVDAIFRNLKSLRALDLSYNETGRLPDSICKLKHLRYLDLSYNENIKELPNSVTNLHNLLVLNLQGCYNLMKWPMDISKLVNLTEINTKYCGSLNYMPKGIGKLTRLEKLPRFIIAKDYSTFKHVGGIDELHSLNNLTGDLEIRNLRYVKDAASEFANACLSLKHKLEELSLHWGWDEQESNNSSSIDVANDEMGMEALRPHRNLRRLKLWGYRGEKPPSWLPSITNLMSLEIERCSNLQRLPPLDHLPHLQWLWASALPKLESIDVESGGQSSLFFPSLAILHLENCPNLKGFEKVSTQKVPCLSMLYVRGCPNLTYLPLFPELECVHCDDMKSLMGILTSLTQLRRLTISWCPESELNEWPNLRFLSDVEFRAKQNLVSLPKGLQYATTLERLEIYSCHSLESIPEWMPQLIALQYLTIADCPQLQERCNNIAAADWPKISHIPNLHIDGETIQRDGCYLL